MTNGEKIRQMDDWELAEFICQHMSDCDGCPGRNVCKRNFVKANGLKEWLKMEAEE